MGYRDDRFTLANKVSQLEEENLELKGKHKQKNTNWDILGTICVTTIFILGIGIVSVCFTTCKKMMDNQEKRYEQKRISALQNENQLELLSKAACEKEYNCQIIKCSSFTTIDDPTTYCLVKSKIDSWKTFNIKCNLDLCWIDDNEKI